MVGERSESVQAEIGKEFEASKEYDFLSERFGLGFQLRLTVVGLAKDSKVAICLTLEFGFSSLVGYECKLAKALVGLVCADKLQNIDVVVKTRWVILELDSGAELAKSLGRVVLPCLELKIRHFLFLVCSLGWMFRCVRG